MRASLFVTTAVLALTSVVHGGLFSPKPIDVKADAQIDLVPFDSPDCSGVPQQSPHKLVQGICFNFKEAHSMKPMIMKEHRDWIEEINSLRMHCKLETFGEYHCNTDSQSLKYESGATGEQPGNLNKCLRPSLEFSETKQSSDKIVAGQQSSGNVVAAPESLKRHYPVTPRLIRSARFSCGPVENPEHLCTSTLLHTSWSIDPTLNAPVSMVQKATYTGTLVATPHTKNAARTIEPVRQAKLAPRDATVKDTTTDDESKGVWMLHPWAQSVMCYKCWPKKHDYRKIECRGGEPFPVDCGPMPQLPADGNAVRPSTTTATVTAVTTTHSTQTRSTLKYTDVTQTVTGILLGDHPSDGNFPDLDIELSQKRSWHTPVKFPHPFLEGKVACADAEWEKRGQGSKSYVKLQHVHFCGDGDRSDSHWIGFPNVVHTATFTKTTSSLTISHTSTSTSIATVGTTTTTIVKHDQL